MFNKWKKRYFEQLILNQEIVKESLKLVADKIDLENSLKRSNDLTERLLQIIEKK